ncbi:MAG: MBL fold metallo-hydrolase [Phycisphaerales bacterium]|nr:MAG: MBL fold metallo-hydrolase [Phycisphaerales bacterium]
MMKVEPFELYSIVTGSIRLDGGAMFGVVPKALWQNVTDVDELNRIPLATRTLLAVDRQSRRVILTETGCGAKWAPELADRFAIRYDREAIPRALEEIGLSEEDVTDVVITHLHFDHNGGLTDWYDEPDGQTTLRYPQARHWVHKGHWEHANDPHSKDRASFIRQDFAALTEAGILQFVEGEHPNAPFEGLEWFVSHGHTPFQLHPILGSGSERVLFIGDVIPTVAHLPLNWVMAYDMAPLQTIAEREAVYRRCFDEGLKLAFPHDPKVPGVAIEGKPERPIVTSALPL